MFGDEKGERLSTSKLKGNIQVRQADLFHWDFRLGSIRETIKHFDSHPLSIFRLYKFVEEIKFIYMYSALVYL